MANHSAVPARIHQLLDAEIRDVAGGRIGCWGLGSQIIGIGFEAVEKCAAVRMVPARILRRRAQAAVIGNLRQHGPDRHQSASASAGSTATSPASSTATSPTATGSATTGPSASADQG